MATSTALDLKSLRFGALLNTASGSCDVGAEAELQNIVAAAGLNLARTWCGGGEEIAAALKEARSHDLDVLIVLGGDGTIRSAAETCKPEGPLLVALPGGTMNMLPKALYGERRWQDALKDTLAEPVVQPVSGGQVGEAQFFVAAILGNPSLWAEAREAVRTGDLNAAITRGQAALQKSFAGGLRYDLNGEVDEAEAVAVLCPLTSAAMKDDAKALEVAVFTPAGAFDALKLALASLVADWRKDESVTTHRARSINVSSDEPIKAILDGESQELDTKATVTFVPVAFKALRPADATPA